MKRIVYMNEGVAAVVTPVDTSRTIEEIAAKDVPAGVPYQIVDVADLPTDRKFRNAWECGDKVVSVNLPKAKVLAHEKRREARAKEFAPLDVKATALRTAGWITSTTGIDLPLV